MASVDFSTNWIGSPFEPGSGGGWKATMRWPATAASWFCRSRWMVVASRLRWSQGFSVRPAMDCAGLSIWNMCSPSGTALSVFSACAPNSSFCCSVASGAEVGSRITTPWSSCGASSLSELV